MPESGTHASAGGGRLVAVGSDERTTSTDAAVEHLRARGFGILAAGPLADRPADWVRVAEEVGLAVAEGRAEKAVLFCYTGTGASIAVNKVPGVRGALCVDAETARGARRWNDANVLALSLRATSEAELGEILDAWFAGEPSGEREDIANVEHIGEIEQD